MTVPDLSGEARFTVFELAVLRIERALSTVDPLWVLVVGMAALAVFAMITAARISAANPRATVTRHIEATPLHPSPAVEQEEAA